MENRNGEKKTRMEFGVTGMRQAWKRNLHRPKGEEGYHNKKLEVRKRKGEVSQTI